MSYHNKNYIQCQGNIFQVCQITHEGNVSSVRDAGGNLIERRKLAYIEPVPITTELLDSLGFKKGKNSPTLQMLTDSYAYGIFQKEDGTFRLIIMNIGQLQMEVMELIRVLASIMGRTFFDVKFIHQIQNLFEAIEGIPLVFNDKNEKA